MQFGWRSRPRVKGGAPTRLSSKNYITKTGVPTKQVPSECTPARPPDIPKCTLNAQGRNRIDLLFEWYIYALRFYWMKMQLNWNWNWNKTMKPSQAKPNEVRFEMLMVSRAQDPEAWGRVCRIVTVSLEHSQSLQMIHVSCPLETKEQELTRFFWRMKMKKFWMNSSSPVCIPETWGRVSWIEIHPFDVSWNTSHRG